MKAKSKGKELNKGVKKQNTACNDPLNTEFHKNAIFTIFSKHMSMENIKPSINATNDDPLTISIQEVIEKQLDHLKLNDEEIKSVVQVVNDRDLKDLFSIGQGIKKCMLKKW